MKKSGYADLPLHGGQVPKWLAERMALLGGAITEAILVEYGKKEFIRRLSDPAWFQSLGCVMGMDWHSSGITTSVLGALKTAINPRAKEFGIYICGGRGKHSRKTPEELLKVADSTGLDGQALVRSSRLTAKVDNTAIQDGFQIYLHSFVVSDEGDWSVVQQGMNTDTGYARRYHWSSNELKSFVNEPHAFVFGKNQGYILNLTHRFAEETRDKIVTIGKEDPGKMIDEIRKIHLPPHHDVRQKDVDLKRLGAVLALSHELPTNDFEDLLLVNGLMGASQISDILISANSNLYLHSDLVVTNNLTFAGAGVSGNIDTNGQTITLSDPIVYAPGYSAANTIYLGATGSMVIQNVTNGSTAIFPISYDNADASYARVEMTNQSGATVSYDVSLCNGVYQDGTCSGATVDWNKVNTTWFIGNSNSTGNTDMTLYWNEGNQSVDFDLPTAEINHYGTEWTLLGTSGSTGVGDNNHYASAIGVASFSPFSASSSSAPLPVELTYFDAVSDSKAIKIEWETATELNNDYFLLEKSVDGITFNLLGKIDGTGNSSEETSYHVMDWNPVVGYQYYRLTQVDFDGTREELGVRIVEFTNDADPEINLFPNPAREIITISNLNPGYYIAEIVSMDGKPLYTQALAIQSANHVSSLDLRKLPDGIYTLNLRIGSLVYSRKIVKK